MFLYFIYCNSVAGGSTSQIVMCIKELHESSGVFSYFSLLSKNESRLIKSPACLSVPIGNFHEIWYGCNAIQGDLSAVISNPLSLTILK
jgi:hypothetical protein